VLLFASSASRPSACCVLPGLGPRAFNTSRKSSSSPAALSSCSWGLRVLYHRIPRLCLSLQAFLPVSVCFDKQAKTIDILYNKPTTTDLLPVKTARPYQLILLSRLLYRVQYAGEAGTCAAGRCAAQTASLAIGRDQCSHTVSQPAPSLGNPAPDGSKPRLE